MKSSIFRPANVYYGWIITLTLALTETVSWGIIYYAFSVYITPMEAELGWSRAELTGAFSLMLLIMGGMAYPVGAWVDKHGSRLLMTIGSILAALLVIAWSQVSDLGMFYLIWAGLGVCAAAVLYDPAFIVIAAWFTRRRSLALAIITFAAGLASTIFVPLADLLLNSYGWRDAVLILGVLLGVITIPLHALVLRRRPHDLGLQPDGGRVHRGSAPPVISGRSLSDALHSRFFWLLTLAFSLAFVVGSAIRVHFIPMMIDVGVDASTAALGSGAIGIMQVVGRLFFAPLDARLSIRAIVSGIFSLQAAAMLILLAGTSGAFIALFIVVFGTSYGAKTLARPAILAEVYGSRNYGRISSVMVIFLTIAGTAAPVGAGLIYDQYGSYEPVLWIVLLLAIASVGVMLFARPDTRKQVDPQPEATAGSVT